jgi:predicted flap endonuclease-1-like 5' DNA nuclease
MNVAGIEGIGETYAAKLKQVGVVTVANLLEKGASAKGRKELAQATGVSDTLILKWVNRADMFRVKGVSTQYSDLLEAAGVDTVVELANRKAANLTAKLAEVNAEKKLVRQLPAESQVAAWIECAKGLERVMTY